MMTDVPDPRVLALAGSHNVRDLGGLPSGDGRVVRTGRLFRSDYPAFAEGPAGAEAVRRLGLRTVVDLRRGSEVAAECVAWEGHGVEHVRFPIVAATDSWHARYASYLAARPESVVGAVTTLMASARQPALFHCAAGKDRTGVVAALLLSVLGVEREVVVEDYELTRPSVAAVIARLADLEPYRTMLAGVTAEDQDPRPDLIAELLDHLEQDGGAESWLLGRGVEAALIQEFRDTMLVDAGGGQDR